MSDAARDGEPDLGGEPGWRPLERWLLPVGMGRHFLSEEPEGDRVRVRYYEREADGAFMGRIWYGPGAEGPPGHAHGGSIAAVLDEVMGLSCWLRDVPVVAARLEVDYRAPVPLEVVVTGEGVVEHLGDRKITTRGRILGPDGSLCAEGRGVYVKLSGEQLASLKDRIANRRGR
ncbi:MAG: PaaI family thioesterase [Myxococcota bacterium]